MIIRGCEDSGEFEEAKQKLEKSVAALCLTASRKKKREPVYGRMMRENEEVGSI